MEGKTSKFMTIAVEIMLLVLIIAIVIGLATKGKTKITEGSTALDSTMDSVNFSQYELYTNSYQSGSTVIRLINSTMSDSTVSILVSTKDGCNYIYNSEAYDADTFKQLTNRATLLTTTDSVKPEDNNADAAVIRDAPSELKNASGYDITAGLDTKGYISANVQFYCTAQYDINDNLRVLTFVQQ